jgi:16S rRNA processing protein RimM
MENNDDTIRAGKILSTHGVKGFVKAESLSDYQERFNPGEVFLTEKPDAQKAFGIKIPERLTVEKSAAAGKYMLLKFEQLNNREEALLLSGVYLLIYKKNAAPLPAGHYYYWQLEGLKVRENGAEIGFIREVRKNAAHDLFFVEEHDGGGFMLPALKEMIPEVNTAQGFIEVKLIPGIKDLKWK